MCLSAYYYWLWVGYPLQRYGHSKFSKMGGRSSVLSIYIDVMYTPLRHVRNVAREELKYLPFLSVPLVFGKVVYSRQYAKLQNAFLEWLRRNFQNTFENLQGGRIHSLKTLIIYDVHRLHRKTRFLTPRSCEFVMFKTPSG